MLRGFYAVTPDALCADPARLREAAQAALRGGARLLQVRDKSGDGARRLRNAAQLLELCRAHGAALIVNDDVETAAAVGADGVHLGASDTPLRQARTRLGPRAIVGISCANVLARALDAQAAGASYVAFGRFFSSRTKPNAPQAPLELLQQASSQLRIPICAIGGVTPANARTLIDAGASLVAAVEGVFGTDNIEAAAQSYSRLFDE